MPSGLTLTHSGISWKNRTAWFLLAPLALLVLGSGLTARAGTISYTCGTGISAGTCGTLNTTIAGLYSSTFTNASASIFIQLGTTGLGQSNQFEGDISYGAWRAALGATASGDATDTAFLANDATLAEPTIDGSSTRFVQLTTAEANAVGITDTIGITTGGSVCFTVGSAGCYNGIITVSNTALLFFRSGSPTGEYDFFTVAEHETDEILGTSSCLGSSGGVPLDGCGGGATDIAPTDLGRFASAGTRSFLSTANGTLAYFSADGGATVVENYNNLANGADYGDWSTLCSHVQDAFGCLGKGGLDITNDGGVEIKVLDAVGYNLTTSAAAEPSSLLLLALVILGFGGFAVRERFCSRANA